MTEKNIYKKDLWEDFLDKKNKKPLLGFLWEPDVRPIKTVVDRVGIGNELKPDDFQKRELREYVENVQKQLTGWGTDFPQAISVNLGIPWIEAIIGCKLIVQEDSVWAKPPDNEYKVLKKIDYNLENPWLSKLIDLHKFLVDISYDRFPISLPVMHGPLDVISAFRSPTKLCFDLYDRPEDVKISAEKLKNIWIKIAKQLMEMTPPYYSGWFTRMNIYLRNRCATPQSDFTSLISEKTYRDFGLEIDKDIMNDVPSQTYHTHSTSWHVLKIISQIPNLKSLQITIDPNGPSLEKMKKILVECQKNVPLLISVWNIHDCKWFIENLSPRGLAVVLIKIELTGREEFNNLWKTVICKY